MSVSKWRYTEECNGRPCPGDCDHCSFEPGDLISRADAIEAVRKCKVQDIRFGNVTSNMILVQKAEVITKLMLLPSANTDMSEYCDRLWKIAYERGKAEAEAVQGEWIVTEHCSNAYGFRKWIEIECPFCGEKPTYENLDNMNFCPNCGAIMKGGDPE